MTQGLETRGQVRTIAAAHEGPRLGRGRDELLAPIGQVRVHGHQLIQQGVELAHQSWAQALQHVQDAVHLHAQR